MAKSKEIPSELEEALVDLLSCFRSKKIDALIIGGIAASILGKARLTEDIDALVLLDASKWKGFLKSLKTFGFVPRIQKPLEFALQRRVMLLKHAKTGVGIDISFGVLPFEEESMKRKLEINVGKISMPLPTPEDLIIMKAVAHRRIDMGDIEYILKARPTLNFKRIRKWVKEFAKVLEMPEIYEDLEKLLKNK